MDSSFVSRNPFSLLSDNPDTNKKETSKSSQKKENSATTPVELRNSRLPSRNAQVDNTNSVANENFSERRHGNRYPRSDRNNNTRGTFNNRRQYDRHSATGLVDSDKKKTQGWLGKDEATLVDGEIAADEAIREKATEGERAIEGEKVTEEQSIEQAEEDNVTTFEDYLKQQAEKDISNGKPKKEARKANQDATIDVSQLREALPLEKSDEVYFAPKNTTTSNKPRKSKQPKEKVYVGIEQRFNDPENRRNRFTKNNTRQNGGFRRQHSTNTKHVDINNTKDFPAL